MMNEPAFQLDLLDAPRAAPPGFAYRPDLISREQEAALTAEIEKLGHAVWIDRRELSGGPGWVSSSWSSPSNSFNSS